MKTNGYEKLYEILNQVFQIRASEAAGMEDYFFLRSQKRGELYVSEGEIPDSIAFVITGLYKYYYIDRQGNEWIKHFTCENDFIASYAAFIRQEPSLYYIEALEDAELLVLKYDVFMNGFEESLYWQNIARKYTERIYIIKELREGSLLKENAEERYRRFIADYPGLLNRLKQKDIASYLGITPETLSRIKSGTNR